MKVKKKKHKTKIMASSLITSWQIDGETMETVTDCFLGSKITADGDCSCEIKRRLLIGRKDTDVYSGLLDSEGEGEGGMIWENGILTCILSCKNQIASLCPMQDTACLGLVHGHIMEEYIMLKFLKNQCCIKNIHTLEMIEYSQH